MTGLQELSRRAERGRPRGSDRVLAGAEARSRERRAVDPVQRRRPNGGRIALGGVAAVVIALLTFTVISRGDRTPSTVATTEPEEAASEDAVMSEHEATGDDSAAGSEFGSTVPATSDDRQSPNPSPDPTLESPPHLMFEVEGWTMAHYFEESYIPRDSPGGLRRLFRAGPDLSSPMLSVGVYGAGEAINWSVGSDAESVQLDRGVLWLMAEDILPNGSAGLIEFDTGETVVLTMSSPDRAAFVEMAASIRLTDGAVVTPLDGFEELGFHESLTGPVTHREAVFEGAGGANAETRTWSATETDISEQAFSRAVEAIAVRDSAVDGVPVIIADHSGGRFFIVGGAGGFLVEIDLQLPGVSGLNDPAVDAAIEQLRFVDLATFESAMPPGSVTTDSLADDIADMLADVPLPEGFDTSALSKTGDRYHVGVSVAGHVACAWIEVWIKATAANDEQAAKQAADALATSRSWPILVELESQGGYPMVVWQYADAVNGDGTVVGGRVLTIEESYRDALGCSEA